MNGKQSRVGVEYVCRGPIVKCNGDKAKGTSGIANKLPLLIYNQVSRDAHKAARLDLALFLKEGDIIESEDDCLKSLFGKVLGDRKVNFTGLKKTMMGAWSIHELFILREIGFNKFETENPKKKSVHEGVSKKSIEDCEKDGEKNEGLLEIEDIEIEKEITSFYSGIFCLDGQQSDFNILSGSLNPSRRYEQVGLRQRAFIRIHNGSKLFAKVYHGKELNRKLPLAVHPLPRSTRTEVLHGYTNYDDNFTYLSAMVAGFIVVDKHLGSPSSKNKLIERKVKASVRYGRMRFIPMERFGKRIHEFMERWGRAWEARLGSWQSMLREKSYGGEGTRKKGCCVGKMKSMFAKNSKGGNEKHAQFIAPGRLAKVRAYGQKHRCLWGSIMDEIVNIVQSNASLSQIEVVEKYFGPQRHNHVFGFGGGMKRKYFNDSQMAYIKELEAMLHDKEKENNHLKRRMDTIESRLARIENDNQPTSDARTTCDNGLEQRKLVSPS
ncbi:hypothetical protein DH2020_027217 [Rehmannia glutinosa]|uniref:Uncharacterized protein n=1 Tax=Rehmannia glutinosa TaxID=99300 RepID=A0ABR0VYF3_REHGL